jgi:hypothetical protein
MSGKGRRRKGGGEGKGALSCQKRGKRKTLLFEQSKRQGKRKRCVSQSGKKENK